MQEERRFSPILIIVIVMAVIAAVIVGFFGLGSTEPAAAVTAAPVTKAAPTKAAPAATTSSPLSASTAPAPTDGTTPVTPPPAPIVASTPEQRAREEADVKIGTILANNPTVEGARDRLLGQFSTMTPYEKIAAAPHINNLTGDDKLRTVVDFLKNPNTPAEAQEVFFNDMLNRQPQIGWPVLVEVIATPNHPLSQRAKELLTTIVGEDHGNDVFRWQEGLRKQLELQGAIPSAESPPAEEAAPAPQQ